MKVYEAIARALVDEEVRDVFTLLGTAIVDCAGALDAAGVALRHVHHEAAGLAMADGYARASGRVGVCAFTWGPGITNATLGLYQAARAGTPVVLLTAQPVDPHEVHYTDHRALVAAAGAGYELARTPAAALAAVQAAFYRARTERRPVLLELPPETLRAPLADYHYRSSGVDLAPHHRVRPDRDAVTAAARTVSESSRPVVIAGRGALRAGARHELRCLGEQAGALLATTLPLLGWFHDDPYDLGVAGGYARPLARELIGDADCVVAVGAGLNPYTTDRGRLFGDVPLVRVDTAPAHLAADGRPPAHYLRGDAAATSTALADAVSPAPRYRTAPVRERIAAQRAGFDPAEFPIEPGRLDPRPLLDELDAALPAKHRIVFGSGHQRDLGAVHLQRWRGPHISSDGAIGQGLSFAIGAAIAEGRPVVAVEGDGGVLMHIQELATAVRYRLPVLLLVMNNAALGSEYYQLPGHGFDPQLAVMPEADFAVIARGFGARAVTVTRPEQLREFVDGFVADPAPAVADVRVSREVISIRFRARIAGGP